MRWLLTALAVLLIAGLATSRVGEFNKMDFYVVLSPAQAVRFAEELANVARESGLSAHVGQATDDQGRTLHVVEASNLRLRLWAQNLPLSGHEDPSKCGRTEARPDPGQFIVSAEAKWPLMQRSVSSLSATVSERLRAHGYDVRQHPATCSDLAKE